MIIDPNKLIVIEEGCINMQLHELRLIQIALIRSGFNMNISHTFNAPNMSLSAYKQKVGRLGISVHLFKHNFKNRKLCIQKKTLEQFVSEI